MVDDFRPPSRPRQSFDQNQNQEPGQLSEPPKTDIVEAPQPDIADDEKGFVVIPSQEERKLKRPKNPFKKLGSWLSSLNKKQKALFFVIIVLVLAGTGAGSYALFLKKDPSPPPAPAPVVEKVVEPPKPTTEASKLSGVQVDPAVNQKPIYSIQIENSPDARPQSSLHLASVVFEAIAEGGITRFNASFLDNEPDYIGPIRSVRPYYAELTAPFDPIFVHAGGSADGLAKISQLGLKDMDHGANGSAFERVSDRYAPHNLYSNYAALKNASDKRGYTTSNAKSFVRKEEKPATTVTARSIDMNISGPLYNTHYDYDPVTNTYKRSLAGAPHTDQRSGTQISPKVVIALVMNFTQNGIYSVYQTNGTGTAYIFQDGEIYVGTWKKTADKEQISFLDTAGKPLGINPGQTWLTLVKTPGAVSYAP